MPADLALIRKLEFGAKAEAVTRLNGWGADADSCDKPTGRGLREGRHVRYAA
jgi:hypothetical protein